MIVKAPILSGLCFGLALNFLELMYFGVRNDANDRILKK